MNQIILYGKKDCPRCDVVKTLLDKRQLKYDINYDEPTLKAKGYNFLPMVEINGTVYTYAAAALLIPKLEDN